MNIKTRTFKLPNLSKIFFKETFSNFLFGAILAFIFLNWLIGINGSNIGIQGVTIIVYTFLFLFVGGATGPGETFTKNYNGEYENPNNIDDIKKGVVYLILFTSRA